MTHATYTSALSILGRLEGFFESCAPSAMLALRLCDAEGQPLYSAHGPGQAFHDAVAGVYVALDTAHEGAVVDAVRALFGYAYEVRAHEGGFCVFQVEAVEGAEGADAVEVDPYAALLAASEQDLDADADAEDADAEDAELPALAHIQIRTYDAWGVELDAEFYLVDTAEQIGQARLALRDAGFDWAPVWYGQPGSPDVLRGSWRLFAAPYGG